MNEARRAELERWSRTILFCLEQHGIGKGEFLYRQEVQDAVTEALQQVEREVWTQSVRLADAAGMVVYLDVFTSLPISFIRKEDDECQQREGR
jgi:hypothetical protein